VSYLHKVSPCGGLLFPFFQKTCPSYTAAPIVMPYQDYFEVQTVCLVYID